MRTVVGFATLLASLGWGCGDDAGGSGSATSGAGGAATSVGAGAGSTGSTMASSSVGAGGGSGTAAAIAAKLGRTSHFLIGMGNDLAGADQNYDHSKDGAYTL